MQHPSLQEGHGLNYSPTGHELDVARTFAVNLARLKPTDAVDQMAQHLLSHDACFAPGEPLPQTLLQRSVSANSAHSANEEEDMKALLLAEDGLRRLVALGFLTSKEHSHVVLPPLLALFAKHELSAGAATQTAVENTAIQMVQQEVDKSVGQLHLLCKQKYGK